MRVSGPSVGGSDPVKEGTRGGPGEAGEAGEAFHSADGTQVKAGAVRQSPGSHGTPPGVSAGDLTVEKLLIPLTDPPVEMKRCAFTRQHIQERTDDETVFFFFARRRRRNTVMF